MAPRVNITIDSGTTFQTTIALTDYQGANLNVTGLSAYSQMRKFYGETNAVSFSCSMSNGSLVLSMNAATTANLDPGRWVYDVDIVDSSNNVSRLVEGIVTVFPGTTNSYFTS